MCEHVHTRHGGTPWGREICAQAVLAKTAFLGSRSKNRPNFECFFTKTPLLPTPENVPGTLFIFEPPPPTGGLGGGRKFQTWVDCLVRGGTPPLGGVWPKGSKSYPAMKLLRCAHFDKCAHAQKFLAKLLHHTQLCAQTFH